jgi:hypothetical protein
VKRLQLMAASVWLLALLAPPAQAQPRDETSVQDTEAPANEGRALTPEAFAKLLERYADEPSVADVVAAALHAERSDPARFADMASRARLRGLVPHLDVGARRGQGVDLRWTTADQLDPHSTTADDLLLFATLRFDFERLLFASEEVTIAREARFERQAQRELVRQVVHLYYLRRRLLLERDLRGEQSLGQQLRIAEVEAMLEAFTDGAFERMLRGRHTTWKTGASTNASKRP